MNPYEPSQTLMPVATSVEAVVWQDIFWEWERRRILYNVILVIIVLASGIMFTGFSSLIVTLTECVAAGFIANCCFCAGPVAETYLTWRSQRRSGWGSLLFVAGLIFSILVTLIALKMHDELFILPRPMIKKAIQN